MPLLRLEVENFKSYRGHQVIGPFKSFSAVIGPNGSGKSNLMDAISYVLGVRSAQLRSSNIKDVVFRGRRMEGGDDDGDRGEADATKASVTAVYRDTTGKEWRFQRSITLNGASEYRVNGRVTTYNSYNATLEKFKILVKAKNFLVFQGDVEAVASQNSRDLAKLIDQISGSLELKEEYEEAKERMERSQEESASAFNKRRAINGELKTFREQKSEAEKWERLQEQRDIHIVQLLLWQLYHIRRQLEESRETIDEQKTQLPELRHQLAQEEKKVEAQRKGAANAQRAVAKAERDIKNREKEVEDQQPSLDALDEQTSHSKRRIAAAENIISDVERDLDRSRAELAKREVDFEGARKAAQRAEDAERERGQGLNLSEQDLEEYHNLRADASIRKAAERQQLESLKRQLRAEETTLQSLEDRDRQLQRAQEKLEGETQVGQEKKDALTARRAEIEQRLKDTQRALDELRKDLARIGKRETALNDTLQSCYTKLIHAGDDARETEREAKMKETFATLAKMFPGVRGRLVDLCKPTQHKYDQAITTVLGRNSDSVIVEQEKTAIECVEYLRNQRLGHATFLPLDTIRAKPINDRLRSVEKGARLAIDVIQYDPSIERALQYVCGNALVCDDLKVARAISFDKNIDAKTVTLDGTIIHRSGLMTGGQSGERGARRFEEREVEGLQRQKTECMAELKRLAQERRDLTSEETLRSRIGECESQLSTLNDDLSAAESRLNDLQTELTHVRKQLKDNRPRLTAARALVSSTSHQMDSLRAIVDADDDEVFAQFCSRIGVADIREYEERQLRTLERQKDARMEFETQMKRLQHQIAFIDSQINGQEERLQTNRNSIKKETQRLEKIAEKKVELQTSIEEILADIEQLRASLGELREKHEAELQSLSDAKKRLNRSAKALDGAMKEIANLNDHMERLAVQRTGLYKRCRLEEIDLPLLKGDLSRVKLDGATDLLPMDDDEDATQRAVDVPDYGLEVDFSELDPSAQEDGSAKMEAELKERIEKTISTIEKMAPNMKAAGRLDDTEARYKATDAECEDAREEASAAKRAFNDIKKRRCDLFNKAFNHISGRIDSVYKDLTKGKAAPNGGVAYLGVEDTEEPYLSGVKYHAMPPMKRFRDMDQLSGGEKTMAALALLFCVATFAPPPFFVLDEVDAALDSQNVAKVAAYIRSRARPDFQFIVISLKASLYERAEGLVGVYRRTEDEQNASATLTLDLEKYQ